MASTELFNLPLKDDANLKAYYRLTDLLDETANSFDLTNNNTATFTAAKFGNGVDLGSSDGNKALYVNNDLGITNGNCSISAWVKLNTEIASGEYFFTIVADADTDVFYILAYEYNSGTRRVRWGRGKSGVANNSVYHTANLGTTDFHHLVVTYNGTNVEGWLDGVSTGTIASSGNGTAGLTDKFVIGADLNFTDNNALAIIDDVAVFNRALTAGEVLSIYRYNAKGSLFFAQY